MYSSAPICLFVRPCAASSATRRSVSVSSSEAGARPLIPASSARAFSPPHRRTELLEDGERLLQGLAGGLLLLRLPAHRAQAEQRATSLVLVRLGGRRACSFEGCEGRLEIAGGGSEEAA